MPYIKGSEKRIDLVMQDKFPENAGELNFVVTEMLLIYLHKHGQSYQIYNDIMGALEGAKLEMYRRSIAPYEDEKIDENGDVYE